MQSETFTVMSAN